MRDAASGWWRLASCTSHSKEYRTPDACISLSLSHTHSYTHTHSLSLSLTHLLTHYSHTPLVHHRVVPLLPPQAELLVTAVLQWLLAAQEQPRPALDRPVGEPKNKRHLTSSRNSRGRRKMSRKVRKKSCLKIVPGHTQSVLCHLQASILLLVIKVRWGSIWFGDAQHKYYHTACTVIDTMFMFLPSFLTELLPFRRLNAEIVASFCVLFFLLLFDHLMLSTILIL